MSQEASLEPSRILTKYSLKSNIGLAEDDFTEFEVGVDYFDGRNEDHIRPDTNLNPDQYRWDSRSIYYYLNAQGELVARVNKAYTYPSDV